MKNKSSNSTKSLLFLLLPLLLCLLTFYFVWEPIEKKVADNVRQSLIEKHAWAEVETFNRGRDVLLLGMAPNNAAIEDAKQIGRNTNGVRTIDFVGDLAPGAHAELELEFIDNKVLMSGSMDQSLSIEQLITYAKTEYQSKEVESKIQVGDNTAAFTDAQAIVKAAKSLGDGAVVRVNGQRLELSGSVISAQAAEAAAKNLSDAYGAPVENRLRIVPIVEKDICEDLLAELLETAKINFDSGQATILESSTPLIGKIASTARRCPDAIFEVAGHTDSIGSQEFNQQLSEKRANAVIQRVVALGLEQHRFEARGYGTSQSVGDNNTEEGRAANRRIEFKLSNKGE